MFHADMLLSTYSLDAVDRADLENAAFKQRHSADSVGGISRPSESARAHFHDPEKLTDYVKKPLLSREGANLTIRRGSSVKKPQAPTAPRDLSIKLGRASRIAMAPIRYWGAG